MRKILFILFFLFFIQSVSYSAITTPPAYHTTSATEVWDQTAVLTLGGTITVPSSTNGIMIVRLNTIALDFGGAVTVAWGAQSLTKLRGDFSSVGGGRDPGTEIWYVVAPTAATAAFLITLNGSPTATHIAHCSIDVFEGVDQSTPSDETGGEGLTQTTGTTITDSITTTTAGALIIGTIANKATNTSGSGGVTPDTGQTEDYDADITGATDYLSTAGGYETIASPGAESMGWSSLVSDDSTISLMALKPASASTAIKTINGLAKASVKTKKGLAIASVKTINGLA